MKLATMLAALGRRTPAAAGSRIGSVSAWLTKLEGILGADAMAAAAGVSEAAVKQFRRRSSGVMVYFDRDNCTPTATAAVKDAADVIQPPARLGKDGAGLKVTGTPQDVEGATAMTGGSILDFECVMTTGRRDRDGDVLDPKGAILDAKMPLLWQHLPFSPVGRMVKTLDHSDEKVAGKFMVANTELGNDVATLIDAGCLRISHGFAPIEYNPLKDEQGKDMGGWRISKYAMMECSVVSIPSNVDAEITAFSRGKLHHPLTKSFAKVLFDARPLLVSVLPAAKAKAVAAAVKGTPPAAKAEPVEDEEDEEDTDKAGDDAEDDDEEDDTDPTDGAVDLTGATEDGDVLEDADAPTDPSEMEEPDESGEEEAGKDAPAEGRPLADVLAAVAALGKGMKDLPREAAGRIALVQGMFEDIDAGISAASEAVVAAAKARDIVGMCDAMAAMTDGCTANLGRAAEELERLQGIADLPDAVGTAVGDILADANAMVAAVSALSGDAAAGTGADDPGLADMAADADAEDDDVEKDGDDDELSDDDIDAERYGAEDDDEEEDADAEKDGDAEDDEEDDEEAEVTDKADEDDDRAEKGTDDEYDPEAGDEENPEAEAAGGANPGVPAGGRRRLSDVLARSILGGPTTTDERRALRQRLGSLAAD